MPPVDGMFRQVTDIAWDAASNAYISDGYVNSRIAKIDKDGNWLRFWVNPATSPASSTLRTASPSMRTTTFTSPIAATAASRSSTSMENSFANSPLTFRRSQRPPRHRQQAYRDHRHHGPGAPWAICITPPPNQVLYSSDGFPGRIYKLSLDGKVLGVFANPASSSAIRLGSRNRLPLRKRTLCRRSFELARPETRSRTNSLAADYQQRHR